jgi:PAS domain S-box-containing protein
MKPTAASIPINEEQFRPYFDKINLHADRIAMAFMIGFFVVGIGLSFFFKTYAVAILMGGASMLIYFLMRFLAPNTTALRLVTSFLFWNFGLQFLIQMQGLAEMKFVYFIALTVLLFYEDWKILLPVTIYALASLIYIHFSESDFVRNRLPQSHNDPITTFIIQIAAILFYSGLCVRWAMLQRNQTRESAIGAILMEDQLRMMDVNVTFADHISQGNLKADYGERSPDKIGSSLLHMRDSLIQASEREEREKFANIGLARVGELLRQHADNLGNLCDRVVEEVVKYMKANQGFMYVIEQMEGEEKLKLMAGRAWERKKYLQKAFDIGQGLIGQSAIEKQTIFMTKVPENYISITSGLGAANPRCILIVPLKSEDIVVGVIELASFRVYEEYEIKFMEKVAESIASTILTTKNNQKNKELLEQSKELTEQMRSQEEEIRQNMEEMQATQEEMQRKNSEIERLLQIAQEKEQQLKSKLSDIQKIQKESETKNAEMIAYMQDYRNTLLNILDQLPHKIFLKDKDGKMVLVNTVVAKAHNMEIDELIGKSDFDFVDAETAQQWRNQELEIIRKGSETYIFNETLSGETRTLKSTKMAFYIPHLKQTGLLGIQTDITELEQLKIQADAARRSVVS